LVVDDELFNASTADLVDREAACVSRSIVSVGLSGSAGVTASGSASVGVSSGSAEATSDSVTGSASTGAEFCSTCSSSAVSERSSISAFPG